MGIPIASYGGASYFGPLKDYVATKMPVVMLNLNGDACKAFKQIKVEMEKATERSIKALISYNET